MDKIDIFDFLNLKEIEEEKRTIKTWLALLMAFTIIFMDIGYILNYSEKKNIIYIPISFSALVLVEFILYFTVCKKLSYRITYSILYVANVTAVTAMLFYLLFLMSVITGKTNLSISHFIILSITFMLSLVTLIYRQHKYKSNKNNKMKPIYYTIIIPFILLSVPILKRKLSTFNDSFILTIAFLILGGIWLLMSLIYWQNYYYGQKNNIDKIYSEYYNNTN